MASRSSRRKPSEHRKIPAGRAAAGSRGRRKQEAVRSTAGIQGRAEAALESEVPSSWPEKTGRRTAWREHRLVTVLLDGSELGFATEPVDVAATKTPFSVAKTLCDVAHFFPISMGLRCECLAHHVRLTRTANLNPKENDHGCGSSRRKRANTKQSQQDASAAEPARGRQKTRSSPKIAGDSRTR